MPSAILEGALLELGMPRKTAELIIEMWDGANAGLIVPQEGRSPKNTTFTTLEWFIKEDFVPAYLHQL